MTKSLNELNKKYFEHYYNFDKNYHTIDYCYANYFINQYKIDYECDFIESVEKKTLYKYFIYNFKDAVKNEYHNICVLSIFNTLKKLENINIDLLNNVFKHVCQEDLNINHDNINYLIQLIDTEKNQDILESDFDTNSYISYNFEDEIENKISNIEKSINIISEALFKYQPISIYEELTNILFKIILFLFFYFFIIYNIILLNDLHYIQKV